LEAGAEVVLLDSMAPEYGGNLFNIDGIESRVKVNISDVRDPHSMHYIVQGHDYLFNLAGQTSHLDSMLDPFTDLGINCGA
jgi:UDP-glucose 4-epimerase